MSNPELEKAMLREIRHVRKADFFRDWVPDDRWKQDFRRAWVERHGQP